MVGAYKDWSNFMALVRTIIQEDANDLGRRSQCRTRAKSYCKRKNG